MLYLSTGDGGGTHDPFGNAQSLAVLFGKVLRGHDLDRDLLGGHRAERMHFGKQDEQLVARRVDRV